MRDTAQIPPLPPASPSANWIANASLLWEQRRTIAKITAAALLLSAILVFSLPKQYESAARLMPPDQQGSSAALLAAVSGRSAASLGPLASLAGGLLGGRTSTALFMDLLQSSSISGRIIDRFNLQSVYGKRYRIDTEKYLARHTSVVDDKKSGVITLTVTDKDPVRARDIAQAYVEELNQIVTTSNTSSARREREFIESRLVTARQQLNTAEKALSEFSSVNTTLDIKEQTHTMVDAAARLQAELIAAQSERESLTQVYGDDNVRLRAARARIASLQHELTKLSGSSAALISDSGKMDTEDGASLYPSLRQLPRLAVPYAALYRDVRIREMVFELLSQEYEAARIEEAKDMPVVSVFDPPLVPEKKSSPHRLLLMLAFTAAAGALCCFFIVVRFHWDALSPSDPRRQLIRRIAESIHPTGAPR